MIENLNIENGTNLNVKLTDFGTAISLSTDDKIKGLAGSPNYMAPEVVGDEEHGTKADIWSAGVVTYILLSGEMPFYGHNFKSLKKKILKNDIDFSGYKWT